MKQDTETKISKTELHTFKRQVKGFIRWIAKSDEQLYFSSRDDIKEVSKAKTFEEAQKVLKCWDDGTFMAAVMEGYF